ncbi:MAG: hypothetical protein IH624_12230 [Phycisphaerae bacterium]|nr:hypothetical protein [Phycisphaerae bacterium]
MNHVLYIVSLAVFWAGLPILLWLRFFRFRAVGWWQVLFTLCVVSWFSGNAMVYFHFEHLYDIVKGYAGDPPAELLDRLQADGGPRVFALYFGWAYGLFYAVPWLVLFAVAWELMARRNGTRHMRSEDSC